MWIPLKDVKDFDVPIGAVVKSVDGLGMLLTDDQGEVRLTQLRHKNSLKIITTSANAQIQFVIKSRPCLRICWTLTYESFLCVWTKKFKLMRACSNVPSLMVLN